MFQSKDIENEFLLSIYTFELRVMAKRRVESQIGHLIFYQ
jgi:hypothetical protein